MVPECWNFFRNFFHIFESILKIFYAWFWTFWSLFFTIKKPFVDHFRPFWILCFRRSLVSLKKFSLVICLAEMFLIKSKIKCQVNWSKQYQVCNLKARCKLPLPSQMQIHVCFCVMQMYSLYVQRSGSIRHVFNQASLRINLGPWTQKLQGNKIFLEYQHNLSYFNIFYLPF